VKLMQALLLVEVGLIVAAVATVRTGKRRRVVLRGWSVVEALSAGRYLLFVAVMAVAGLVLMWISFLWALDPDPHVAVMDKVAVPASWGFVDEELDAGFMAPDVKRYYPRGR
jgi:hypothetical protein